MPDKHLQRPIIYIRVPDIKYIRSERDISLINTQSCGFVGKTGDMDLIIASGVILADQQVDCICLCPQTLLTVHVGRNRRRLVLKLAERYPESIEIRFGVTF